MKKIANIGLKIILVIIFSIIVFYPNPIKLVQQLSYYKNPEQLIQKDFPGIESINAEIDSLLPPDCDAPQELKIIERYVYQHIHYRYDWDLWMNADYWPKAGQVWQKGYEDCDGRAVLAASILRSRGFKDVKIVGNTKHVWVQTGETALMGPDTEKLIEYKEGEAKLVLPSWKLLLESAAFSLYVFPYFRIILLLTGVLFIFSFPQKKYSHFIKLVLLMIIGYILLLDWAKYVIFYDEIIIQLKTILGCILILGSILAAIFQKHSS